MPEHNWVYWEPTFADESIAHKRRFVAADLGSFTVGKGDIIWLVSFRNGILYLNGKMEIGAIDDRIGAEKSWRRDGLWDGWAWPPPFPVPLRAAPGSSFRYRKPRVCVFATPGTEEPYRRIPMTELVSRLRFKSATSDRLTIERGKVITPQEAVYARRLTRASGEMLQDLWEA